MKKSKLLALAAIMFFDYTGLFIILPLLSPMILSSYSPFDMYHLKSFTVGALVATFGIGQFLGAPFLGALSDTYGRKPLMIVSLSLNAFSYLLAALSVSIASLFLLFLSRFLIGLSSGNSAILFAIVADSSNESECGKNMGYLTLGLALGGITGPLLGGYLSSFNTSFISGYTIPFLMMSIIFLFMIPIIIMSKFNKPASINELKEMKYFFLSGFRNLSNTLVNAPRKTQFLYIAFFAFAIGTESMLVAMPLVAVSQFSTSPKALGWLFAVGGIASFISSIWINRYLNSRYSPLQIVILCSSFLLLAYLLFIPAYSFGYLFLPWIIMAINCLLIWSYANSVISKQYDEAEQGAVMGISQSLVSLAIFLGPLLVGLFSHISPRFSFLVSVFAGTIALWLFYRQTNENI